MDISLKKNGTLQTLIQEYITESVTAFGGDIKKYANMPTKHNLFTISEVDPLGSNKAETFHHIVAKLLYVCKRSRVGIEIAVAFMRTRVSHSTNEYC